VKGLIVALNVQYNKYTCWNQFYLENSFEERSKQSQIMTSHFSKEITLQQDLKLEKKKTPWSESVSELCRPSDRRLSAKQLPACADRGCHVVSVTDPSGRILSVF
jgi:hypothetical protein